MGNPKKQWILALFASFVLGTLMAVAAGSMTLMESRNITAEPHLRANCTELDSQIAKTEEMTSQLDNQIAGKGEMPMTISKMGSTNQQSIQRLVAGGPSLHSSSFLLSNADKKYCKPAHLLVTKDGNIIIHLGKPKKPGTVVWPMPGSETENTFDIDEKAEVLWSSKCLKNNTPWWSKLKSKHTNHGSFELRVGFHGVLAMTNTETRRIVWRSTKKKFPRANYVASLNCSTGHIDVELEDKLIWTSAH
uniref:Bulb-type lectin domain-containing protein n=1 Tax=Octactis speculum TaxID=3111310 RepID=A0A7S2GJY0_9STRA|mmetsp:Transcript_50719/g.69010  ORF Transcript_50719/g.69010 Transcript_50719/m.69010 type:complete len:248 (+) Transcript_50719:22-765(+)